MRIITLSAACWYALVVFGGWAKGQESQSQVPGQVSDRAANRVVEEDSDPEIGEIKGKKLSASDIGPGRFVNLRELSERVAKERREDQLVRRERNGAAGEWVLPSASAATSAHSGTLYAMNRWGDTRMGIGFGEPVDLRGVWIAGQTSPAVSTDGVRAIGMRDGVEVARTEWFEEISMTPIWFPISLENIDRVVFEARQVVNGAGWFAVDDLSFVRGDEEVLLDFEDLRFKYKLSGSDYGGLDWERGSGDFTPRVRSMPPPGGPLGDGEASASETPASDSSTSSAQTAGGAGTAPTMVTQFVGTRLGDPGSTVIPPDTCGAVGIDHFVLVTNSNISVYEKTTGARVVNAPLNTFFNIGSSGDPRITFDPHSQRWFMLSTNFNSRVYLAASQTSDPTGVWFTTFFVATADDDAGAFPDYPTLGVNAEGVFTSLAMFRSNGAFMTMFAIDKAPLIAATPSLGTVTAYRSLGYDAAIQPCVTYGDPGVEYFISRRRPTELRVRQIVGPMTNPTLFGLGNVIIPSHVVAQTAPAMGSTVPLDTVGARLMNSVYRNGSIWAAHTVAGGGGRTTVRWYEVDPLTMTLTQSGTVSDPELSFLIPSIAVNEVGDVLMGFSGASPNTFAGAYVAGRVASDPPGQMSPPALMRFGGGPYNRLDGNGRNRWGDYSLTSVDPDGTTLWTSQEFARNNNTWGTWVASYEFADCGQIANYCTTAPNSATAGAVMAAAGSLDIGSNDFTLQATEAPANNSGIFYYGANQVQSAFGDGFRCVGAVSSFRLYPPLRTDLAGNASVDMDFTAPPASSGPGTIMAGSTWNFQFWFRDPAGPGATGFNLSDGLQVTFCP